MLRLLQFVIILLQFFGTLFAWLDTARINARNPRTGFTFGDPPGYTAWYYHMGLFGFSLLFLGILLQGVSLLLA